MYPPYQQTPPQQPVAQPITLKCRNGTLTVTPTLIQIGKGGRQQSMSRASLVGVDVLPMVPSFFGRGGAVNLQFHSQGGQVLVAEWANPKQAQELKRTLGY